MAMNENLRASALYRSRFGKLLAATLLEIVLRLIVLAPLLTLVTKEVPWLAVLTPVLFVLIVLPARQNAAEAMRTLAETGDFELAALCSVKSYGGKLKHGLRAALPLIGWFLPFIAATGAVAYAVAGPTIEGVTDVFSLVRMLQNLGGGSTVNGIVCAIGIYALTLLPGIFGMAFHSGLRHSYALTGGTKLVRGHRGGLLLAWLRGLLTMLPFAVAAVFAGRDYAGKLVQALSNLATGIHLPSPDANLWILLAAAVLLCFPLIPLKSLITSVYCARLKGDD